MKVLRGSSTWSVLNVSREAVRGHYLTFTVQFDAVTVQPSPESLLKSALNCTEELDAVTIELCMGI